MYGRQLKSVTKSLRMTPDMEAYINSFPGDKFQQKFDNMVEFFRDEYPKKQRELDDLICIIECKKNELQEYRNFISNQFDIVELAQEFTEISRKLKAEVEAILAHNEDKSPYNIPFGENTV